MKIENTKIFCSQIISTTNWSHTATCKQWRWLCDPKGMLFSAIPAKAIVEAIGKSEKQLKTWLDHVDIL